MSPGLGSAVGPNRRGSGTGHRSRHRKRSGSGRQGTRFELSQVPTDPG